MQDYFPYRNLLRAADLAKRNNVPYVPYDKYELGRLPLGVAVDNLPKESKGAPEGWRIFETAPISDICDAKSFPKAVSYETFLARLGDLINNPAKHTVGVMVSEDGFGFNVYHKI
jgi:hypothetical protein